MRQTPKSSPGNGRADAPSTHFHCVIWLDHREARIIHFNAETSDERIVRPAHPPRHLHFKSGSPSGTHAAGAPAFYRVVAKACDEVMAVLLTGPSTAKKEFVRYLSEHSPQTSGRIWGVETLGDVTDPQLLAEGRRFFAGADRMRPQRAAADPTPAG